MIKKSIHAGLVLSALLLVSACSGSGGYSGGDDETDLIIQPKGDKLAETNVKLGVGYMQQGNYEYALLKFRKALEIDDNLPNGHYAIALLYDRLGKPNAAAKHFERATEINPQYSDAHNAYAAFLCRKKQYDRADEKFRKALANPLYRSHALVRVNAGLCALRAGNTKRAENYFRNLLKGNPRHATALFQMAKINLDAQRFLQARGYIQRYGAVTKHTAQSLLVGLKIERVLGGKNDLAKYALLLQHKFPDSDESQELLESERR
ncbi:MAG: type IV pilus biogenesis/stability protein PilW [Sulfuriflexus sp.]|nr:type IV pilus biogenesis/stability protein PilW [Sulfuriflexus sp.]